MHLVALGLTVAGGRAVGLGLVVTTLGLVLRLGGVDGRGFGVAGLALLRLAVLRLAGISALAIVVTRGGVGRRRFLRLVVAALGLVVTTLRLALGLVVATLRLVVRLVRVGRAGLDTAVAAS